MERKLDFRFLNSVNDIREAALNTVGKELVGEMTPIMFHKYLIAEHSPIRSLILRVTFYDMNYYTSVHFARHVHAVHYVSTGRPDRTKKERTVDDTVTHMMDINCQALIDMARKRLCYKCSEDTRLWMEELKRQLIKSPDSFYSNLGRVLTPNGLYRGFCPEFKTCGKCYRYDFGSETSYGQYNADICGEEWPN